MALSNPLRIAWPLGQRHTLVLSVFALSVFLSAALLFSVQPMFAKMVLPLFGGAPAVWNTTMVFFQVALLAGYAYAHLLSSHLTQRRQLLVHGTMLAMAALVLPITLPAAGLEQAATRPVLSLLALSAACVGPPFFALSATAPLVQRWFSRSGHPDAEDPYFLYAASNLGSLAALLGYPLVLEPLLALDLQSRGWSAAYLLAVPLIAVCGVMGGAVEPATAGDGQRSAEPLSVGQQLHWCLYAAVPSALLLGVTNHITTDIAAVPLFWVVPLALYLVSFVIAFARRPIIAHAWVVKAMPFILVAVALTFSLPQATPLLLILHLAGFFAAALLCHGELARARPPVCHLTRFYLLMSVGGALGGAMTAIVAPLIFDAVYEYPIALAMVAALIPAAQGGMSRKQVALVAALAVATFLAGRLVAEIGGMNVGLLALLVGAIGGVVAFLLRREPLAFALAIAVVMAGAMFAFESKQTEWTGRSFFGVYRVARSHGGAYRLLFHGTTMHGAQYLDRAREREPLSYYTPGGPFAEILAAIQAGTFNARVALVGLGTGTMACFAGGDETWRFYEIDPLMVDIAANKNLFSFMTNCAPDAAVVVGDARLTLSQEPNRAFDVIIIDAFSSDSIPIHLMTREAMELYFTKLKDDGLLVMHISNRHLDLEKPIARLAEAAGRAGIVGRGPQGSQNLIERTPSKWIALAATPQRLAHLGLGESWQPMAASDGGRPWTDDYSNVLQALRGW
jgi:hypothetical protein